MDQFDTLHGVNVAEFRQLFLAKRRELYPDGATIARFTAWASEFTATTWAHLTSQTERLKCWHELIATVYQTTTNPNEVIK